ncbi:hypothetical protein DFS34DRAFT_212737 [Phlyctochytrium arcticum]|nr:hypothetical protein DFS34DRAFT_212737 [Phlyctochytrium arcticum]
MSSCLWVESTPGECAVVWNDLPNFYGIHIMALVCIAATSIGSVHVLAGAIKQKKYETYTERLPLYRCAADLLFAIAHVMDHIALISRQRYPDEGVGKLLGTLVFVFVCYQILLTTVLSIQSCLVVIFDISLPFGKYEYRAHLLAFLPGVVIFASANAVNGMGPFLYFQGPNITTFQGQAYTLTAIATFIFAISTVILTSYLTITRVNSLKHNAGKKKLTPQLKQAVRHFYISVCHQGI